MRSWWRGLVVLVLLLVGSVCAFADASLSGDWSLSITFDPSASVVSALSSGVDVTYSIGDLSLSSSSGFTLAGWKKQRFSLDVSLGNLTIKSSLQLNPASASAFKRWKSTVSWEIGEVSFKSNLQIASNYIALGLSVDGDAGDVGLGFDLDFRSRGDCGLCFDSFDFSTDFPWACSDVGIGLGVSDTGFESIDVSVSSLELSGLDWLDLGVDLTFDLESKSYQLSPSIDLGDPLCIDVYMTIQTRSTVQLSKIEVYGFGMTAEFGAVTVETLTYFGANHKLKSKYWEMVQLTVDEETCCGPVSGSMAVYFLRGGTRIFGMGLFDSSLEIEWGNSITFDVAMAWDIEVGVLDELSLGMDVAW